MRRANNNAHRALHGAVADEVQGFLAQLSQGVVAEPFKLRGLRCLGERPGHRSQLEWGHKFSNN